MLLVNLRFLTLFIFLLSLGFHAYAGNFIEQPTMLSANQTLTITKTIGDQYYAYQLKEGEGLTLNISILNSDREQVVSVFSPDNLTQHMFFQRNLITGRKAAIDITAAANGLYLFKVSGGAAEFELTLHPAFYNLPEPAGSDLPAVSFNSAKYLSEGTQERTAGDDLFLRFEAKPGDQIGFIMDTGDLASKMAFLLYESPSEIITIQNDIYANSRRQYSFTAQRHAVYFLQIRGGGSGQFTLTPIGIRPNQDDDGDGLSNTAELYRGSSPTLSDTNSNGENDYQMALRGIPGQWPAELSRQDITSANSPALALELPYRNEFFSLRKAAGAKYVKFSVRRNEHLTLSLKTRLDHGVMHLQVTDTFGQVVFVRRNIANREVVAADIKALSSGDYIIEVAGNAGIAELAVITGFAEPEYDNSRYSNGFYTAAYLASGTYQHHEQVQYFRFNANAGDAIAITLSTYVNTASLAMDLYYQDSLTANITNVVRNTDGYVKTLTFEAQQAGLYFLKVFGDAGRFDVNIEGISPENDSDVDGLSDSAEWLRGTDPFNSDTTGSGSNDKDLALLGLQGKNKVELFAEQLTDGFSIDSAILLPYFDNEITLHQTGNSVFFRITAKQGEYFALTFATQRHQGFMGFRLYEPDDLIQPMLEVYNLYDAPIYHYDWRAATSGDYILEVYGVPGVLDFAVWRGFATLGAPDNSLRFNGASNSARILESGMYTRSLQSDYFRFEAQAGEAVTIEVSALINRGSLRMELFPADSNAAVLVEQNIYNGVTRRMQYTAVTSGVHFVKISGVGGRYQLEISPQQKELDSDDDGLSNMAEWMRGSNPFHSDSSRNGLTDAQSLREGLTGLYRTELSRADVVSAVSITQARPVPYINRPFAYQHDGTSRFFSVPVLSGQRYTAWLTGLVNQGSMQLALYKPNVQRAFSVSNRTYNGSAVELSFIAEQDGLYVIEVLGNAGVAAVGLYEGFATAGNYDQKRDFYNSKYTARRLFDGQYQRNKFGFADFYRLDLRAGVPLLLTVDAYVLPGQLFARLLDVNGNPLAPAAAAAARTGQSLNLTYLPQQDITILLEVSGVKGFYSLQSEGTLVPEFAVNAVLNDNSTANYRGYLNQVTAITVEGRLSRFTLTPYEGYTVSARVSGNCPLGKWLDEFTYETGVITAACQISFEFDRVASSRKRLPLWLLLTDSEK